MADNVLAKDRIVFIDDLRAIAIMMVILCHIIDLNCFLWAGYQEMSALKQVVVFSMLILGRCGVPLFLMITGYLMLDRDYHGRMYSFYKGKFLWLLVISEIWFIIYEIWGTQVLGYEFSFKSLVYRLLLIEDPILSHGWYLSFILKVYLLIPLIAKILNVLDKRIIYAVLIFLFVIMLMTNVSVISSYISYILFLLVGYSFKKEYIRINTIGASLVMVLGFVIAMVDMYITQKNMQPVNMWYNDPGLAILACALFGWGMSLFKRANIFMENIARYSFGIYLIHNMIALLLYKPFGANEGCFVIKFIGSYIFVFVISYFVVAICSKYKASRWLLFMKEEENND